MEREITPEIAMREKYLPRQAAGIRTQLEHLVPLVAVSEAQLAADRGLPTWADQAAQAAAE